MIRITVSRLATSVLAVTTTAMSLGVPASVFLDAAPADAAIVCGFCPPITLGDELAASDTAAVLRLVERPPQPPADTTIDGMPVENEAEPVPCTFEVVEVLKGEPYLPRPAEPTHPRRVKILYFGDHPIGTQLFAFGVLISNEPEWGSPFRLSDAARDYLRSVHRLPPAETERLRLFVSHLEHADPILAGDAYDELARVDYSDLAKIKDDLSREKLIRWIGEQSVSTDRRRLYLRMLSFHVKPEDSDLLESMILRGDERSKGVLDGTIFCYLTLTGADCLPLIEELFLANPRAEYPETYLAITALRRIGSDTGAVSHRRLAVALRRVLTRPEIADLVVADLARLRDWDAMPRLVHLFRTADPENSWIRVPVLLYLHACPLPEAHSQWVVLSKLDPEAAKRARQILQPKAVSPAGA